MKNFLLVVLGLLISGCVSRNVKSYNKANWQQCPKAATEAKIEEVIKKENEILKESIDKKIKEVTKMQKVMESKLSKILQKVDQGCGKRY